MGEVVLQLPETLQRSLEDSARREGVALPQYILYSLARQSDTTYTVRVLPPTDVATQRAQFSATLERLGEAVSDIALDEFLAAREIAEPEPDLTPELIAKVQQKIAAARSRRQTTTG